MQPDLVRAGAPGAVRPAHVVDPEGDGLRAVRIQVPLEHPARAGTWSRSGRWTVSSGCSWTSWPTPGALADPTAQAAPERQPTEWDRQVLRDDDRVGELAAKPLVLPQHDPPERLPEHVKRLLGELL